MALHGEVELADKQGSALDGAVFGYTVDECGDGCTIGCGAGALPPLDGVNVVQR